MVAVPVVPRSKARLRPRALLAVALAIFGVLALGAHRVGATSAPSIEEFVEGGSPSTYTTFSSQAIASNPRGSTYIGDVSAVGDNSPTPKVFATGSNGHLYEFVEVSGAWQPQFDITRRSQARR